MSDKFKFKLSKYITINEHDANIIFFAELNNGLYKITWSSDIYPMADEDGVSYTIEDVNASVKDGFWILID